MLPNGYIECASVKGMYDTGVLASSGLEINALFNNDIYDGGYLFGARNSNSKSSAGQLNLLCGSTSYFGYNNGRGSVAELNLQQRFLHVYVKDNEIQCSSQTKILTASRTAASFEGTRTMYINSMNNAGSEGTSADARIVGFIISQNGTVIRDYVPCIYEQDSKVGLFDLVTETFLEPLQTVSSSNYHKLTIGDSVGGTGYITTEHGDRLTEMMMYYRITDGSTPCHCVAEPLDGYMFTNWTVNGNVVSTDMEYDAEFSSETVLTPNFMRISSLEGGGSDFMGEVDHTYYSSARKTYLKILSAKITKDALQKSTSTFIADEIPSNVKEGMILRIYSPKGETVYRGIIKSIEDKTITCRELLSLYDRDYIFSPSTFDASNLNAMYQMFDLLQRGRASRAFETDQSKLDLLLTTYILNFMVSVPFRYKLSLYHDRNCNVSLPSFTETEIKNLEDLILSYASFGIFMKDISNLEVSPYYYMRNEKLTLGDNIETIRNVKVEQQTQEDNVLVIYNSAGSTIRGMYGVMLDGTIGQYTVESINESDFLASTNYHGKVVMSDDPINTLLAQNLSSSALNHKITFDVQFGGMLTREKMEVGTPVDFYIGNRLYKSVVTAVDYSIPQNTEKIQNATITLGNVRNSLTAKLNLKKVK